MVAVSQRRTLAPLALLTLPVGAYLLVLIGAVPMIRETDVLLTGIAGVAALGAALLRATLPALCAATATLGFGLGVIASGFVVTVAAVLAIIGGLGFLLTTIHLVGSRAYNAMPDVIDRILSAQRSGRQRTREIMPALPPSRQRHIYWHL